MYKKNTYKTKSGTESIVIALRELNSKKVIIPSYTCTDILNAVNICMCDYHIVDCGFDLQIDCQSVLEICNDYDTIIIPHMFGIRADVEFIKKNTELKILEDLSQCHGLPNLGKWADVVVSSTNNSKWIDFGGGGFIFSDYKIGMESFDFLQIQAIIEKNFLRRCELANEIKNAGVNLIGNESSWLRGMYFTKKSKRRPYEPLHTLVEKKFVCSKINSYIDKLDWISIII